MICEITKDLYNDSVFIPRGTTIEINWADVKIKEAPDEALPHKLVMRDLSGNIGGTITMDSSSISLVELTSPAEITLFDNFIQKNLNGNVLFVDSSILKKGDNILKVKTLRAV